MQAAWIISVHLVETRLFETSSVLGLRGTGGSKNTISQVVSHELKISEHGFPVRLLHCRPQTHPHPPQTHPHYTARTVFQDRRLASLQPDEEICWNERQRGGRKKTCQVIWTQIHDPHTLSLAPPIAAMVRLSFKDVFTMFYHPIFVECTSGKCELDGKREENVAETPQRSCVSELSRSPRRHPNQLPREPFHKRLN